VTTTVDIMDLLARRYPAPSWAFLPQVRNGTGYGRTVRTADALAMSLYPSQGLHLHGFEVKVSRADWLRELKEPEKADEISRYCHYWWIVAPSGVVADGELPATWGMLEVDDGQLNRIVPAPLLDAQPPSMPMLAAIMRKFWSEATDAGRLEEARKRGEAQGKRTGAQQADRNVRADLYALARSAQRIMDRANVAIEKWDAHADAAAPAIPEEGPTNAR
jgi:hypothetical protein